MRFDIGSTHSFITPHVMHYVPIPLTPLSYYFSITMPSGTILLGSKVVGECEIGVHDQVLLGDLVVLAIKDFDLILGMDRLP